MQDTGADEESEFVKWLNGYLGPVEQKFGRGSYDSAVGLASQQAGRWERLLTIFEGSPIQNKPHLNKQIDSLVGMLKNAPPAGAFKAPDDKSIVTANLPILGGEAPHEKLDQGRKYPYLVAAVLVRKCEAFLIEKGHPDAGPLIQMNAAIKTALVFDDFGDSISQTIGSRIDKLDSQWHTVHARAESAMTDLQNFKVGIQESFENDRKAMSTLQETVSAHLEQQKLTDVERDRTWKEERTNALEGLRSEVNEFAKIETSIDLWRQKARGHTVSYAVFGSLFSLVLIVIAGSLLAGFGSEYIERLSRVPADRQFVSVALLAIPTLAIAWFLRFLARLTLQNLSLAHDARQRHAQISTYLRLLGDPTKPISEQERILALAALFRPMPGQGPDDISPPTTAELVKEALDRVKAKSF